jgi:hypothetical protein
VLGPDDTTSLETITYDVDGLLGNDDEVYINGAEITVDVETTLEAALTAIDLDVVEGVVEIIPADGGDPRQIRVTTE